MKNEYKLQFHTIHEICSEIQLEVDRLTYKPTTGSGRRKQKLVKRYGILKDILSTLASIEMIGKDKILELPILVQLCKSLLANTAKITVQNSDLHTVNTRTELKKIIDKY